MIKSALIVGFGSMGRRRIRLLRELDSDLTIICVDRDADRLKQAEMQGVKGYKELADALEETPDAAFVCTSPGGHADIILTILERSIPVFTELNLTPDRYDRIIEKAKEKNLPVFMSSTMLYRKEIQKIRELIQSFSRGGDVFYTCQVGQYLPDWHPWEDYKSFFVANRETNALREILAIQLPWLIDIFGEVRDLSATTYRVTDLEIDYPDSIMTVIRHQNGNRGVVRVDVASREPIMRFEALFDGQDTKVEWRGHINDLFRRNIGTGESEQVMLEGFETHMDGYADTISEEPYREEIRDFLSTLENASVPKYSLKKDLYTLSLIDQMGI